MGANVMNSDYESEKLHSLEESSSDDDIKDDTDDSSEDELKTLVGKGRGQKRTFLVFKPVAKAEHIRFEKDMLFTTPKQFKEAITDYAVHGGWGIRFAKNDLQREYCEELRRASLGSIVLMKVHTFNEGDLAVKMDLVCGVLYFERLYICLEGCKKGFMARCWPIIGLDAYHLKTKSGGQLITTVARDPNEEYFPLVYAVVEAETKDSWTWFINLILADISQNTRWTFILDQQKGLVQTFIDNWPQYEHRICCRHLYNNLRKNHPGVLIRELFWKVAKATYKAEFDRLMDELKGIDEDAHNWLEDHSATIWARHMFSEDGLSDTVLNNMCKSFNSRILKFRFNPIITMLESIRLYLMTRFQENRQKIMKVESEICPKVLKRLHREKTTSSRWLACWAGHTQFEVKNGLQSFTVDLEKGHCSCRKWDTTGIPCAHAVSYIFFNRQHAEQYVHRCFHVSTYKACYKPPPIKRRPPGRPKKKRARKVGEPAGRRAGISKQCRACGKIGHNKRSCKGEIGGNSSLPGTTNRTSAANKTSRCRNYSNINQPTGQAQAQPSSATPFAPPQTSVSSQSSMHTFTPGALTQPWTSSFRPCATYQTRMHISFSPSASYQASVHFSSDPNAPYQTRMHFSSSLNASYQYTMHSSATPFPPPRSNMHSSSPSAHQTPTRSSNLVQASRSSFFQAYEVQSNSNPITPPNLGSSPIPRLRRKRMVTSETLNASKNASRYMGAIKFVGSQSSRHAPRKNE
ncbi:hypothetical protein SO802_017879 [Lithocarpus litseifolius]|uniref:SWIM-type domain-containing protein n=1 Tax=Lithocarpus litseifolius TaxID=425828 RepID=A0AAW2CKU3_9ROSI